MIRFFKMTTRRWMVVVAIVAGIFTFRRMLLPDPPVRAPRIPGYVNYTFRAYSREVKCSPLVNSKATAEAVFDIANPRPYWCYFSARIVIDEKKRDYLEFQTPWRLLEGKKFVKITEKVSRGRTQKAIEPERQLVHVKIPLDVSGRKLAPGRYRVYVEMHRYIKFFGLGAIYDATPSGVAGGSAYLEIPAENETPRTSPMGKPAAGSE